MPMLSTMVVASKVITVARNLPFPLFHSEPPGPGSTRTVERECVEEHQGVVVQLVVRTPRLPVSTRRPPGSSNSTFNRPRLRLGSCSTISPSMLETVRRLPLTVSDTGGAPAPLDATARAAAPAAGGKSADPITTPSSTASTRPVKLGRRVDRDLDVDHAGHAVRVDRLTVLRHLIEGDRRRAVRHGDGGGRLYT